jgi:hypothetical protein
MTVGRRWDASEGDKASLLGRREIRRRRSPSHRLTVVDAVDTTAKIPLWLSWHFGHGILVGLIRSYAKLRRRQAQKDGRKR